MPQESGNFDLQRIEDLEDHVTKDQVLLKAYEDAFRLEDEPIRLARYQYQIEQLNKMVDQHRREYAELQASIAAQHVPLPSTTIEPQLQEIDIRLRGQEVVATLAGKLDQQQRAVAQSVINAINAGQIPQAELEEAFTLVARTLDEMRKQGKLPGELSRQQDLTLKDTEKLSLMLEAPTLSTDHKLKITVPIIPFILAYESEINVGAVFNLKAIWQRLVERGHSKA